VLIQFGEKGLQWQRQLFHGTALLHAMNKCVYKTGSTANRRSPAAERPASPLRIFGAIIIAIVGNHAT
jgi:hypothetical protein